MITWASVEKKSADGWRECFGAPTCTLPPPPPPKKREGFDKGYSRVRNFFAPDLQRRDVSRCVAASVGRESVSFVPVFDRGGDTELSCQPDVRYSASGRHLVNEGQAAAPEVPESELEAKCRAALGLEELNPARASGLVCRKAYETVGAAKVAAMRFYAAGIGAVVRVGRVVVVTCTVPVATASTNVGVRVRGQMLAAGFEVVTENSEV